MRGALKCRAKRIAFTICMLAAGASPALAEEAKPPARLVGALGQVRDRGDASPVDAAFAADGKRVLTVCKDGSIDEWEIGSGQLRWKSARAARSGTNFTLSPDGAWAAWGTETGFAVAPTGTDGPVRTYDDIASVPLMICFSRDGARVAAACQDGLGVWDVKTGERVGDASWAGGPPAFLLFAADGASLVVALRNHEVRRLPVAPGVTQGTLEAELREDPLLGMTPTATITYGVNNGFFNVADLATGKNSKFQWWSDTPCCATLSRDGNSLVVGFTSGFVRCRDIETRTLVWEFHPFDGLVGMVAWSADEKRLIAISPASNVPCVIDAATGTWLPDSFDEAIQIDRVVSSPDGRFLAAYTATQSLSVWDLPSGLRLWRGRAADYLGDLVFSPDGSRLLATYGADREKSLELFDAKTGKVLAQQNPEQGPAAWSADGLKIACRAEGGFEVLDALSRKEQVLVGSQRCRYLSTAFSPDGLGLLVVASKGDDSAVDGQTGYNWFLDEGRLSDGARRRKPAWIAGLIHKAVFSPDARMLAVWLPGSTLILDTRTGTPIFETSRPAGPDTGRLEWPVSLAWSSDGKWLASTRKPGRVDVIDVARGRRAFTLKGPDGSFAWIPRTSKLASAGGEKGGKVLFWDATPPPSRPEVARDPLFENGWRALGVRSGTRALRASKSMAQCGDAALAFLAERLKLPPAPSAKILALVKKAAVEPAAEDDDAGQAAELKLAKAIARAGGPAEPALRAALETEQNPVIRARLEALLARQSQAQAHSAADRRENWAVRILEGMKSRETLVRIAEGPYRSRVRAAATDALKRLEEKK